MVLNDNILSNEDNSFLATIKYTNHHNSLELNMDFLVGENYMDDSTLVQYKKEMTDLHTVFNLPSFKSLMIDTPNGYKITNLNQYVIDINDLKNELADKKLPLSVLENFFTSSVQHYAHVEQVVCMAPNNDFPVISTLYLQHNESKIINGSNNYTVAHKHDDLQEKLLNQEKTLADCKDPAFVKSQLKPTKDAIKKLKTTHADFFKSIETNKKLFEQYLNDTGLKDTYKNTHTGELKRSGKKQKLK